MAYDGYRPTPNGYDPMSNLNATDPNDPRVAQHTTPYPTQYGGSDRIDMPQPQMPPPTSPSNTSPESYPDGLRYPQPHPGSINEAINSAFYKADTSSYISPEALSQITANVIQQLKANGLSDLQGQQQQQPQPQPQPQPQSQPQSQPPWLSNAGSPAEPTPVHDNVDYPPPPSATRYPNHPRPSPKPTPAPPLERRGSMSSQTREQKELRPKPPSRDATVTEMTTLEKIWGKLFTDGKPTERLGQFLRGIAVHLIENYPPGNTIVVVPEKLQKFYEDTKVQPDPYPWHDIFDDRTSSISRLFREVEAEHHLVQEKLSDRPDIPGLTPRGFERWATLMIQAHPDREYERLQKAVLEMPISNPDDKKERFPKEIPRRLFPEVPDLTLRERLDQYLVTHCGVDIPPITEEERAKVAAHRPRSPHEKTPARSTSPPPEPSSSFVDGGRQTHSTASSVVVDDEDETTPSRPIERERKPYSAQPGGGKVYGDSSNPPRSHTNSFSTSSRPKESLHSTSSSVSGHRSTERYKPDSSYSHGGLGANGAHRSSTAHGRSRSSSIGINARADYRHSEGDLLGHESSPRYTGLSSAGDYYTTSPASTLPGDIIEDSRRYRDLDRDRNDEKLYEAIRERDRKRERERSRYHDHLSPRGTWPGDEDYYRGMLGGQGSGPVGSGSTGYDYKTYTYR